MELEQKLADLEAAYNAVTADLVSVRQQVGELQASVLAMTATMATTTRTLATIVHRIATGGDHDYPEVYRRE